MKKLGLFLLLSFFLFSCNKDNSENEEIIDKNSAVEIEGIGVVEDDYDSNSDLEVAEIEGELDSLFNFFDNES